MQKFRKITHFLIVLAITSNIVGIHCGRWLWTPNRKKVPKISGIC